MSTPFPHRPIGNQSQRFNPTGDAAGFAATPSIDVQLREEDKSRRKHRLGRKKQPLDHAGHDSITRNPDRDYEGFGPLAMLFSDPGVSDILINGPHAIFVERYGRLEHSPLQFRNEEHLAEVVQRMVTQAGSQIDDSCRIVDLGLADGSRIHAVFPPLAPDGTHVSIRKSSQAPRSATELVMRNSATANTVLFLAACVAARLNILVSGETGSGKSTLLNVLASFIPGNEHIVVIEDSLGLHLSQPSVIRKSAIPSNNAVDLFGNKRHLQTTRMIVGELQHHASLQLMRSVSESRPAILATLPASDTQNAMDHLALLVGLSDSNVTPHSINDNIGSAFDIVVHTSRLSDGNRAITQISEVTHSINGNKLEVLDILKKACESDEQVSHAHLVATGYRPTCLAKLTNTGIDIPLSMFDRQDHVTESSATLNAES